MEKANEENLHDSEKRELGQMSSFKILIRHVL